MLVRFIAHAGISIEEGGCQVLVDPWFLDSTPEHPVIESIGGRVRTIDFQVPETRENIESYAPDIIAVSHFHAHHSPARDIGILIANAKKKWKRSEVLYPDVAFDAEPLLEDRLPHGTLRRRMRHGDSFSIGPFTITAKGHTYQNHTSWLIASATGSVLHIADAQFNRDATARTPDPLWHEFSKINPSLLLVSAGGHQRRERDKSGAHTIVLASSLMPSEAAVVTGLINPRAVGVIGIYNQSIWKGRLEYSPPASQTEEEFQWALSWLNPDVKNVRLSPGHTFGIGEQSLRDLCSTYLDS